MFDVFKKGGLLGEFTQVVRDTAGEMAKDAVQAAKEMKGELAVVAKEVRGELAVVAKEAAAKADEMTDGRATVVAKKAANATLDVVDVAARGYRTVAQVPGAETVITVATGAGVVLTAASVAMEVHAEKQRDAVTQEKPCLMADLAQKATAKARQALNNNG